MILLRLHFDVGLADVDIALEIVATCRPIPTGAERVDLVLDAAPNRT